MMSLVTQMFPVNLWRIRISVSTPDFHSGKGGSIPPCATISRISVKVTCEAHNLKTVIARLGSNPRSATKKYFSRKD